MRTYLPSERLKPYIEHFVISESNNAKIYKVIPGTSVVMGFQYSGRLTYFSENKNSPLSTAGITGLMSSFRVFSNTPATGSVLVVFKETGVANFLKPPVHELFNESLSLDHFFSRAQLAETEEKLSTATGNLQRIKIIEHLLINHLNIKAEDKLIIGAINLIKAGQGNLRITSLAQQLNISQSPLEKRFRNIVGTSPKKFSSIIRLKNTLAMLNAKNYQEVVYLSGYYDQAHFIKNFKTFTGSTPEEYVTSLPGSII